MTLRHLLLAFSAGALLALSLFSWLESRADRARLAATLETQKQLIAAIASREQDRASELKSTLDEIAALKRDTQTPQQILRALPQYLPLPQPITFAPSAPAIQQGTAASGQGISPSGNSSAPPSGSPASPSPGNSASEFPGSLSNSPATPPSGNSSSPSPAPLSNLSAASPSPGNSFSASSASSVPPVPRISSSTSRVKSSLAHLESQISNLDSQASGSPSAPEQGSNPSENPSASLPKSPAPPNSSPRSAVIPAADLKPLFDFVQDCRACQSQLATARANLQYEQSRSAALTHERDAALQAAKGGSFWRRLKRNTKWLALGAAVGALLARTR